MDVRWICEIMGMAEKVRGEDSSGRELWRRCGTTGMYTAAEEMQDRKIRYVGRHI